MAQAKHRRAWALLGDDMRGRSMAWHRQRVAVQRMGQWKTWDGCGIGIAERCSGLVGQCAGIALTNIAGGVARTRSAKGTAMRRHWDEAQSSGKGKPREAEASHSTAMARQRFSAHRQSKARSCSDLEMRRRRQSKGSHGLAAGTELLCCGGTTQHTRERRKQHEGHEGST